MKTTIKIFTLAIFAGIFGLISCSEKGGNLDTEKSMVILSEDVDLFEELIVEEIIDEVIEDLEAYDFLKSESTCPVKTIESPEDGNYPKVVTKDYGEGCVDENGNERSGKIIVTVDGPYLVEGTKRIVTFDNYTNRGVAVSGVKEIICEGLNEDGLYIHAIHGDLILVKSDSAATVVERKVRKTRTLLTAPGNIEGPKEWLVEGYVKATRSNGITSKMSITTPLHRIRGCKWYQAGVQETTYTFDADETRSRTVGIDYSYAVETEDGCDSYALRWVNDGEPLEINLSKK